jgi:hypothetical protein
MPRLTEHLQEVSYLGFQCIYHPSSSPDLALTDYHLFPGLKKELKIQHFLSDEVISGWMDNILNFF